jgi:GTP cyclohydrolase FolE2
MAVMDKLDFSTCFSVRTTDTESAHRHDMYRHE